MRNGTQLALPAHVIPYRPGDERKDLPPPERKERTSLPALEHQARKAERERLQAIEADLPRRKAAQLAGLAPLREAMGSIADGDDTDNREAS